MSMIRRALGLGFVVLIGLSCRTRFPPGSQNPKSSLLPCDNDMGCPPAPHSCMISACNDLRCMLINAAANTIVPDGEQVSGDCGIFVCDGNGNRARLADANDLPADDQNPCTDDICDEGNPAHPPIARGEACTTEEVSDGVCNGDGKCGVCLPDGKQCAGNAAQSCNADGQWDEPVPCPESSPLCMPASASCLSLSERHWAQGHVSCGRFTDGTMRCRGEAAALDVSVTARPSIHGAEAIAAGAFHLCALLDDGRVACTGQNDDGELGTGDDKPPKVLPVIAAGVVDAAQVTAGDGFSCARLKSGQVQCWGRNDRGQLGTGSVKKRPKNAPERGFDSAPVDGGSGTPVKLVAPAQGARAVVFGPAYGCVLRGGSVLCFGERSSLIAPELEPPPDKPSKKPAPVKAPPFVKDLKDATDLAAGASHACAILSNGSLRCWGSNEFGQLGDGTTVSRAAPVEVKGVPPVQSVVLGEAHTCALLADNTMQCWGDNGRGQLGDGTEGARGAPSAVTALSHLQSIHAGRRHTCAVLDSNALYCFGENGSAQMDDSGGGLRKEPNTIAW